MKNMYTLVNGINVKIIHKISFHNFTQYRNIALKPPWKVLFFGTDNFSLPSLKFLNKKYKNGSLVKKLEVITSLKPNKNVIEQYALKENLIVHNWPVDPIYCKTFNIGLVVSFGYLISENIINSFQMGMLNVHASLLPRWRGAAPIIYAIANGDKETGVTIMKIRPSKFDIGEIIAQQSVAILPDMKMPALYNTLAHLGAEMLLETLSGIPTNLEKAILQPSHGITYAPRITPSIAQINWNSMSSNCVYNLYRALVGVYALSTSFNDSSIKLYDLSKCIDEMNCENITPGSIRYGKESKLLTVQCADGKWINIGKVGLTGRKIMTACDFYNGFLSKKNVKFKIFQ